MLFSDRIHFVVNTRVIVHNVNLLVFPPVRRGSWDIWTPLIHFDRSIIVNTRQNIDCTRRPFAELIAQQR